MKIHFRAFQGFLTFVSLAFVACVSRPQTIELDLEKREPNLPMHRYRPHLLQRSEGALKTLDPKLVGLPIGWEVFSVTDDFPQALYQGFCSGKVDTTTCMFYFNAWQFDTASYSSIPAQVFLSVAFGRNAEGAELVMFDTDGDCDFSDESAYQLGEHPQRIKMTYERVVNKQVVPDVTWLEIIDHFGERCLVMHEMTQTVFTLDGEEYTCSILPASTTYDRNSATIRITTADSTADYRLKEYARLGDVWYRLDSLSPDGRHLRLEYVPGVENLESTQVGFRPHSFTATDMTGRLVRFPDDFVGKYVLLDFWTLSCSPCRDEICNLYPDIYARFHDFGFEIVGVANNTAASLREFMTKHAMPWVVIADRDNGKVMQQPYEINSYPTLLLIGPDGLILEKGSDLRSCGLEHVLRRYIPDAPQKRK